MSETSPQLGEYGYLPDLIPDEFFDNPFEAKIVTNWWTHPELPSMADAITPSIDTFTPKEVLEFAQHIDKTYIAPSVDYEEFSWLGWNRFDNLVVDEAGVVHASLGHISDVKKFFETPLEGFREGVVEDFTDGLYESLLAAAERWQGAQFADELVDKIHLEQARREELKQKALGTSDN